MKIEKVIENYVDLKNIKILFNNYRSGKNENLFDLWLVILTYYWIKYSQVL